MRARFDLGALSRVRLRLPVAIVLALAAVMGGASRASAFHTATLFTTSAGAGGADYVFYTGSRRDHGWTCAACHVEGPGQLRVLLSADNGLLDGRAYVPDTTYQFTIAMREERLGLGAARSNFNGMAAVFHDAEDRPAGSLVNVPADRYITLLGTTLLSSSTAVGVTSWSFGWVAPPAGTGPVTMYLAVVDGDGAGSGPTETLTDPFGDDVVVTRLRFDELPSD